MTAWYNRQIMVCSLTVNCIHQKTTTRHSNVHRKLTLLFRVLSDSQYCIV